MGDLFNTVMAALAQPRKGIAKYEPHKYSEASRRICQKDLIGAQKFTVCNSLVEHAVLASFSKPKALVDMCELAVPPFRNMWIEWDETHRMELLRHYGTKLGHFDKSLEWTPDGWGEEVGYHIWNDPPMPQYHYSQYAQHGGQVHVPHISFSLTNEGKVVPPMIEEERRKQRKFGKLLLSSAYAEKFEGDASLDTLYSRMNPSASKAGSMILPKELVRRGILNPKMKSLLMDEGSAMAFAGDTRFLITVLALINYPHTTSERKVAMGPPRIAYGRRAPRNELRVLEIDLPKPKGTTQYARMFKGGGGKKRRHIRRGHWRKFSHEDGTVSTRWIGEQWVGSADVGTITHDYQLANKRLVADNPTVPNL